MTIEPALVDRARDGDLAAFEQLVVLAWEPLVRTARAVLGDGEAEDAVQDSLVVAWRQIHRLRESAAFESWLARIVVRQCLRRAGSWWRVLTGALTPADVPAVRPINGEQIDVWRLLGALPARQRAVLHLTVVEGMSDSEIGALLAIEPASVRAHRRRARERIARSLGEQNER